MASEETLDPQLARMRDAFGEAVGADIARRHHRRRVGRIAAGAAAVGTAGVLVGVLTFGDGGLSGSPAQALAVETEGPWVEVQILDTSADEQQMSDELQAAGLDADVHLVPTEPNLVHEWLGAIPGPLGPDLEAAANGQPAPWNVTWDNDILRIRRSVISDLSGRTLDLYIGRTPAAVEASEVMFNDGPQVVSEDGQRILCADGRVVDIDDVAADGTSGCSPDVFIPSSLGPAN